MCCGWHGDSSSTPSLRTPRPPRRRRVHHSPTRSLGGRRRRSAGAGRRVVDGDRRPQSHGHAGHVEEPPLALSSKSGGRCRPPSSWPSTLAVAYRCPPEKRSALTDERHAERRSVGPTDARGAHAEVVAEASSRLATAVSRAADVTSWRPSTISRDHDLPNPARVDAPPPPSVQSAPDGGPHAALPTMTDAPDTVRILRETLELERAATRRYAEHQLWACDPRLCAYWEGLRRNEADHHERIVAELLRSAPRTRATLPADPTTAAPALPTPDVHRAPRPPIPRRSAARARLRPYARHARVRPRVRAPGRRHLRLERQAAPRPAPQGLHARARARRDRPPPRPRARHRAPDPGPRGGRPLLPHLRLGARLRRGPADGATVRCPVCAVGFALDARDGDFVLERV